MIQERTCTRCNETKILSKFSIAKLGRFGTRSTCKECEKSYAKNRYRTKEGLATKLYSAQKASSRQRKMDMPNYSRDDLFLWLIKQENFNRLYLDWINSGYNTKLTPSVDRLDDYKSYTFDNIRLVTWEENNKKIHSDEINGINTKKSHAINKLTMDGVFVKYYYSLKNAERETGICCKNISTVLKGKTKSAGGFKWEYAEKVGEKNETN